MVNVILVRAGENCTIPCLVTDPEVNNLALETCDGRPLPFGMRYYSNLQRGIIIRNTRKEYEGCYVCVGQLSGVKVNSSQYTVDVRLGMLELLITLICGVAAFETLQIVLLECFTLVFDSSCV